MSTPAFKKGKKEDPGILYPGYKLVSQALIPRKIMQKRSISVYVEDKKVAGVIQNGFTMVKWCLSSLKGGCREFFSVLSSVRT